MGVFCAEGAPTGLENIGGDTFGMPTGRQRSANCRSGPVPEAESPDRYLAALFIRQIRLQRARQLLLSSDKDRRRDRL